MAAEPVERREVAEPVDSRVIVERAVKLGAAAQAGWREAEEPVARLVLGELLPDRAREDCQSSGPWESQAALLLVAEFSYPVG